MLPLSNARPLPPTRSKLRVLLAEDNGVNRQIVLQMLRPLNLDIETIADGEQALAAMALGCFDLVLMDCQMPVMDGFAATRAIRKRYPRLHAPIIALTANSLEGDREHCLAAGMNDFLTKPFSKDQLWAMVVKWLPVAE